MLGGGGVSAKNIKKNSSSETLSFKKKKKKKRCEFISDSLDGGDRTELRVTLLAPPGAEAYPFKDED